MIFNNKVLRRDLVVSLYEMISTAYFEYQSEIENHKTMLFERENIIDKQNNLIEGISIFQN